MKSESMTRRRFVRNAAVASAGLAAARRGVVRAAEASKKKFVVGMIGCGGRGNFLRDFISQRPDVEIRYLCDVDENRVKESLASFGKPSPLIPNFKPVQTELPRHVHDYRQILDDKDVHAVFVATPDHWHALPTIHACQAGKDVYVEKPASHNIWEGRQMVKAARKYNRIVQVGTQTRSGDYTHAAVEFIRSGKLGHVYLVRVVNMKEWPSLGHAADEPTPPGVDYDRWLGAAPKRPFNPNHFHYKWHLWWDYSGGDIINDGVHQIDAARMLIGKDYPAFISSSGGRYARTDDGDAPNTQVATWDFGDVTMVFEQTLNTPYMEKFPWELRDGDEFPNWTFDGMPIQIFGSKGMMFFERHGGGWQVFGEKREKLAEMNDHHPHIAHIKNFFDCVESRKRPNADIEEGHRSAMLCQTANISYRSGRRLKFDAKTERFVDDDDANKLVKRVYREPYVVPEET